MAGPCAACPNQCHERHPHPAPRDTACVHEPCPALDRHRQRPNSHLHAASPTCARAAACQCTGVHACHAPLRPRALSSTCPTRDAAWLDTTCRIHDRRRPLSRARKQTEPCVSHADFVTPGGHYGVDGGTRVPTTASWAGVSGPWTISHAVVDMRRACDVPLRQPGVFLALEGAHETPPVPVSRCSRLCGMLLVVSWLSVLSCDCSWRV